MEESTIIAEALELEAAREDAALRATRVLPGELENEIQRLREELAERWPALEPLLGRIDDGDRLRGSDWEETGLGRDAFEEVLWYEALAHQLANPELPSMDEVAL
ncbi:MAG: hypothetical protein ACK47B_02525 [Armatimonadota bacterium]